jgi:hypothetical protein
MIYQAGRIKRRRTRQQIEQLNKQIVDILKQDHPQSIRHVFYRLTDPRLPEPVEKTEAGYEQVQARLVKLRREGVIPYGWLSDMSRRGFFVDTFQGSGDFVRRMSGLYRSDLWAHAEDYCEVWCESRSIAGVIQDDCRDLAVSLYPCGGFASISFVHEAAGEINNRDDDRPVTILYIGDFDPAGVLIDVALERELREHLDPNIELNFVRLGITPQQITAYDLPTKARKKTERRAPEIEHTVEAEAMPAAILRALLRDAIEELLPPDALRVAKVAEESERAYLNSVADLLDKPEDLL